MLDAARHINTRWMRPLTQSTTGKTGPQRQKDQPLLRRLAVSKQFRQRMLRTHHQMAITAATSKDPLPAFSSLQHTQHCTTTLDAQAEHVLPQQDCTASQL